MKKQKLNPGSKEAVKKGCCCPIMDNRQGLGIYEDKKGNRIFVINMECKIHGKKEEQCKKK